MKKPFGRGIALALASLGAVTAPAPAAAQDYEQLRDCFRGCYEAYVVITQQPIFYDQCRRRCNEMYGGGTNAAPAPAPDAVIRYN